MLLLHRQNGKRTMCAETSLTFNFYRVPKQVLPFWMETNYDPSAQTGCSDFEQRPSERAKAKIGKADINSVNNFKIIRFNTFDRCCIVSTVRDAVQVCAI